jgi:hypothetical protein
MKFPNFGYYLARFHGRVVRKIYLLLLPLIVRWPIRNSKSLDADVFAYSSEENLAEQVASVRSFLRHAGKPARFVIVSDGSHSARSVRLLERIDPTVSVRRASSSSAASDKLGEYLATHPTGKQLNLIMNLPENRPAFYADSDVLFFRGAKTLAELLRDRASAAYYLADCQFAGDERFLRGDNEGTRPVNTGVLLLFQKLDWSLGLERFGEMKGSPNFFTNQTMTHLTMHQNHAKPFDPVRFVLKLDDQFVYPDRYARSDLVLRHYVNPVRHKFWTSLW